MNIKSFVVVRSATVQLGKLLVPCKMKRIGEPGGEREVKIALLGEAGVGKSALTVRFITGRFLHRYDPTLEDEYKKKLEVDGEKYELSIFDTAGQEESHLDYYFSTADVLLLAFSLNSRSSLERAKEIRLLANSSCGRHSKLPAVLVGTKMDLAADRQVTFKDGLATAKELGCSYMETSAASNVGVVEAFSAAVRLARHSSAASETNVFGCGCGLGLDIKVQRSAKKSVKGLLRRWSIFCKKDQKQLIYSTSSF